MLKFFEKLQQLRYSQFSISGSQVEEQIEEYWDLPYRNSELLSVSRTPLYFRCKPIQVTMEMLLTFNSIQIDELLKNQKDVFELEDLWLSAFQEAMLSELKQMKNSKQEYPEARSKITEIRNSLAIKEIQPTLDEQKKQLLEYLTSD